MLTSPPKFLLPLSNLVERRTIEIAEGGEGSKGQNLGDKMEYGTGDKTLEEV